MYILPFDREELLKFLPKGGEVYEIGVAEGVFSKEILEKNQPRRLHLVDPWEHQDAKNYQADPNNCSQTEADRRYHYVRDVFSPQLDSGQVQIHRSYSVDRAIQIADGSLDWVYVDARHTYDGVLEDLRAYAPKIKSEGFIVGDDFSNHQPAQQMNFQVIDAVRDFCNESGFHLFAMTMENHPNYVLVKDPNHPEAINFLAIVLFSYPTLIQIKNFWEHTDIFMNFHSIAANSQTKDAVIIDIVPKT